MEWVDVKDRLPAFGQLVIVYTSEEDTYCATLFGISSNGSDFHDWEINCCCSEGGNGYVFYVIYWMPLPEAPKDV